MGAQDRARDTGRKADIGQLHQAIQSYSLDHDKYFSGTVALCSGDTPTAVSTFSWDLAAYMTSVPAKDPKGDDYYVCKLNKGYLLGAKMETIGAGNSNKGLTGWTENKFTSFTKPNSENASWYIVTSR